MFIGLKDLRFCLDKAAELRDQYDLYVLNKAPQQKSIDDLLWICQEYLGKAIAVFQLDPALQKLSINGFYINFGNHFTIALVSGMNFCWKRFVLCKEIFHILLDQDDYRSMEIAEHLAEVTNTFPVADSHPGSAAGSEKLAEIAAMEFMFPHTARVQELTNPSPDYLAIAKKYKVPQVYVEMYCSESYMQNLGALLAPPHQSPTSP